MASSGYKGVLEMSFSWYTTVSNKLEFVTKEEGAKDVMINN